MPANTVTVTVSRVIHPETGETLAFEIVTNDDSVYFCEAPGGFLEGMRRGTFPNYNSDRGINLPMTRVEIARLERDDGS